MVKTKKSNQKNKYKVLEVIMWEDLSSKDHGNLEEKRYQTNDYSFHDASAI